MTNDWKNKTDDQLAAEANRGREGQGAVVEAMRRLREALVAQQLSTNRLTSWILWLTVALSVLVVIQILIALFN